MRSIAFLLLKLNNISLKSFAIDSPTESSSLFLRRAFLLRQNKIEDALFEVSSNKHKRIQGIRTIFLAAVRCPLINDSQATQKPWHALEKNYSARVNGNNDRYYRSSIFIGYLFQRVRQLLYQGRIQGAKKIGRFWQIPLFKGMPKISNGTRGPSSRWRKSLQRTATVIHVNQQLLRKNRLDGGRVPPIIVKRGSKTTYCHEVEDALSEVASDKPLASVEVVGTSRLVYRPEERKCNGAVVWLEIEPSIPVKTRVFA